MDASSCPFCHITPSLVLTQSTEIFAIADKYPVSPGHTLVVPRPHVASIFDLAADTQARLWRVVAEVRARLQEEHRPSGFNIGVNDG